MRQAGEKIAENSTNLWKLFSDACRASLDGIICVFDALDECDPDYSPDLIRHIKDMLESDMNAKFLITTRGYPQLVNQFNSYESGLIHLDGDGKEEKDAIQREISLVLSYKLEQLSKTKDLDHQPERKAAIEKALRSKGSEQRTYLWLKLVFDIMERIPWKSDNDWKKLIVSPPRNVNDAYATLLQNVPEDERYSVKILLHLMVAAFRPLTLREMSIALIVRESPGNNDEKSLGLQTESEFKSWVLQTCGFFVTVYDNKLDFIHQTAKEFLFGSGPVVLWQQGPDRLDPMTEKAAQKIMAESSIAYLSLKCFNSREFHEKARPNPAGASTKVSSKGSSRGTRKSLHKSYGFLDYTTEFWYKHFRLCQSLNGTNFQDVGDEFIPHYISLFISDDHAALGWMFLHFGHVQKSFLSDDLDLAGGYKMFDAALWFDHIRLLVYDLGHNKCTNEFLLHSAAAQNAANCVQYLIAMDYDINGQDETGATALCVAARNTSVETVNMLLDYKADVHLSKGPQKRPLSYFEPYYDLERLNLVRRLVSQGADLNDTIMTTVRMETTMTPLAWAAQIPYPSTLAHEESIRRLDRAMHDKLSASGLEEMADFLQQLDLLESDEFLEAFNTSLVKFLLDHGADINGIDPSWSSSGQDLRHPATALETACHYASQAPGDLVFWNAVFLMHGGANSKLNIETGNAALDWLIRSPPVLDFTWRRDDKDHLPLGSWERWNVLDVIFLKYNPASEYINSPISSNTMQTRLHSLSALADVSYRVEKVRLLLNHGAGVNCQDVYGKTPMHYLGSHPVETEVCAVIDMLIDKGADLEVKDSSGRTPMHYVRSPVVLDMLAKRRADIEARDHEGNTPLQSILAGCGAEFGPEVVQSLIALGADTAVRNYAGETLLHTAATSGFTDGLSTLLRDGTYLDVTNDRGETPLRAALSRACHGAAAMLLEKGADAEPLLQHDFDTEQRDWRTGATLLVLVSGSHTHSAVRALLHCGANPNALPAVDDSDVERYLNRLDCIRDKKAWFHTEMKTLLSRVPEPSRPWHQIDPDHRNGRPLHLAMRNGWSREAEITVDLLLRCGAKIEARSKLGQTPLEVACRFGNEEGVRYLLEHGSHARGLARRWEDTPLGILCQAWQPNVGLIRTLLTHGAMSDLGCLDGPDLWRISHWWSNKAEETSCHRGSDSDAVNNDATDSESQSRCQCRKCCRDHERQACAAVQTLLDAGAWILLRSPLQKVESWTVDIDTPRYWGWEDLATLLEQGAVPNWRRAWLPPNTRRRSWPAATPARPRPHDANQTRPRAA